MMLLTIYHFSAMKNIFLKSRLVVLANFLFLSVSAQDFEVDGIYYNVTSVEDLKVEVTSYGDNHYNDEYDEHKYSGDIAIPETVTYKNRELSVTSIGEGAFSNCDGLTSVDIPDGVTSIGEYAFQGCTGLTSVKIGSGVTWIGEYAFQDCTGLTSVDIPDGVTSIGIGAFSDCDTIEEFVFPAGVDQYPQDGHSDYFHGLFGHYEESNYIGTYTGTLVKKLHISDSTNPLSFEGIIGDFEPYHLKLKELYIGRELFISKYIPEIFPSTLETAEIGGCLKSDIITSYRNTEYGLKQLGPDNIKTII